MSSGDAVQGGRPGRSRSLAFLVGATGLGLALSGCGLGQLQLHTLTDAVAQSAARISLAGEPAGTTPGALAPDQPLVVKVDSGRLISVSVASAAGPLPGVLSADATTWTSEGSNLDYGTQYQVTAAAVDRLGTPVQFNEALTTLQPDRFLAVQSVAPSGTVGVGIPMKVTLSRPVSNAAARARVEQRLVVSANGEPIKGGAWRWDNDSVLRYRPATYWPGNSKITLAANFKGVRITTSVWGKSDSVNTWKTGPSMISYVNLATHQMKVTRDGKTLRTIPIAADKPGFDTRSGIKVILSKEPTRRMDAATGGTAQDSPEYYDLVVKYAMRVTWSGEFLHAAPWSVPYQGRANTSHGCVGMSDANAAWMYANSDVGDVVVFTGSSRQMTMDNGIGDWNVPLARWASGDNS